MGNEVARLNAIQVKNAKPGRHGDGAGLYLLVKPSGSKSWVLRVQRDGKRRDVGLGSLAALGLSEAREKAAELRKHALNGRDPIAERDRDRGPAPTFREATKQTHEQMKAGWVEKNAAAFLTSLETYAYPSLGNLRVDTIEGSHVRDMLAPIWTTKPELARKVRMRVGQVLNFSHSKGWRNTEAPGKTVSIGLPKQPKGKNYLAMPYADVPAFVEELRTKAPTQGRRALQLLILTAARPGEIRRGRWQQVDRAKREWNRPAGIMKERVAHTVTLNEPALSLLDEIVGGQPVKRDGLFFPNRKGEPISDMTMNKVLRDAGLKWDVHGFRSSFRDWAAEQMPEIPDPVVEAALAHEVPDKVVRAYKRTKFIEMRRRLLEAWGEYITTGSARQSAGAVYLLARSETETVEAAKVKRDDVLDRGRLKLKDYDHRRLRAREIWAAHPGYTINRVAQIIAQELGKDKASVMASLWSEVPDTSPSYAKALEKVRAGEA